MGLTTILRGFKIPIPVLDRFLEANGIDATFGFPPIYNRLPLPGSDRPTLEPQSAFLRTKLAGDTNTRIFIPNRQGLTRSTHAYVAYAYIMVLGQRQIDLVAELPDRPPPGFVELRSEMLRFAKDEDGALLKVAGMQPSGDGVEPASQLFVVVTDEREYPYHGPFMRDVSFYVPFSVSSHCSLLLQSINWRGH